MYARDAQDTRDARDAQHVQDTQDTRDARDARDARLTFPFRVRKTPVFSCSARQHYTLTLSWTIYSVVQQCFGRRSRRRSRRRRRRKKWTEASPSGIYLHVSLRLHTVISRWHIVTVYTRCIRRVSISVILVHRTHCTPYTLYRPDLHDQLFRLIDREFKDRGYQKTQTAVFRQQSSSKPQRMYRVLYDRELKGISQQGNRFGEDALFCESEAKMINMVSVHAWNKK